MPVVSATTARIIRVLLYQKLDVTPSKSEIDFLNRLSGSALVIFKLGDNGGLGSSERA